MGRFLNPDYSAFKDVLDSKIYVDKTELLEYTNSVINTTSKFICNSRPRRFGKSITANMMTAYYSKGCDSRQMFSKLKISEKDSYEENLNKYDVIHFDVQWCIEPAGSVEKVVSFITENVINDCLICFHEFMMQRAENLLSLLMNGMFLFEMKQTINVYRKNILNFYGGCSRESSLQNI